MLQTLDRVSHREDYDHDFFDFATATACGRLGMCYHWCTVLYDREVSSISAVGLVPGCASGNGKG